ncbi:MAG: endonuclease III [Ignavibacteriales bacterium]|nr:endonuclease III [Ignavibacteriales bacterium]
MAKRKTKTPTLEELKKRAATVLSRLKRAYPKPSTALHHSSPLQLLVATILSAQCTDERVNMVTKELFKTYRTVDEYASTDPGVLEHAIHSTGFYRAKARNIINCCKVLLEKHKGNVPGTMGELIQLPGVGRKTANVVLGNVFGRAEGIVVDTHVKRLAERLRLSTKTDPEKIEQDLIQTIPRKDWIATGNLLIWHGRRVCHARKPKCPECSLNDICPSADIVISLPPPSPSQRKA